MRRLKMIRKVDETYALLDEIEQLHNRAACPQPFFSSAWVRQWMGNLGKRYCPVLLVVEDEQGSLCGFWPFFEYRGLLHYGLWPMMGDNADFFDPLHDGEQETIKELLRAVELMLEEYVFVWLPLLTEDFLALAPQWRENENILIRTRSIAPYVRLTGTFEDYYNAHTTAKSRKNRRYERNCLGENVQFHSFKDRRDIESIQRAFATIESKSWKGKEKKGIFSTPPSRSFYLSLLPELAERGQVDISAISVEGIYIAYEIGLLHNHWYGMHNIAYLPEYAQYSPGRLLLQHNLERYFGSDYATYDFLQGDYEYKTKLSTHSRDLHDVTLFAPTLAGRLNRMLVRKNLHKHRR